jgi:6-phosphogluconolactonase (cycloisomerase 2 family)
MLLSTLRRTFGIEAAAVSLLLLTSQPTRVLADDDGGPGKAGFVYVMTNQASGNSILVFQRNANGSVTQVQEVATQGQGSGGSRDPLGSQGALTLSDDGRLLLAVNAGSNEISALAVSSSGLHFESKAASGGAMPVSVALRGDIAYVLNAGGAPNVTAFRIGFDGSLAMIAGSTQPLPGGTNAGPAQVGITPDGEVLVVTEKNTNKIDLFPIDDHGMMAAPSSVPSDGATPFGFTSGHDRALIVSEAAASTFSLYRIGNVETGPSLQTITKSLADGGAAACWIVRDGAFLFAANSASDTISSFTISPQGTLQLLASAAATTPAGTVPIDMALTRGGVFLYVIGTGNGSLTGFVVQDGKLTQVASVAGLPASIQGIAAR